MNGPLAQFNGPIHILDKKYPCSGLSILLHGVISFPDPTSCDKIFIAAIIEHVRDGCTVRAFLLPDFNYVTIMLSGIKVSTTGLDKQNF